MTDKQHHQIGVIIGADETNDNHPDYTSRVILLIYAMLTLPILLGTWHYATMNNWSTDWAIVVFSVIWGAVGLMYAATVLGVTVKLLKVGLNFVFRMYTVRLQYKAHLANMNHEVTMNELEWNHGQIHQNNYVAAAITGKAIPLLNDNTKEQFILYVKSLYDIVDDKYVNIHEDGRIVKRVPWSQRANLMDENTIKQIIQGASWKANQPLLYYKNNGWYMNLFAYPTVQKAMYGFYNKQAPSPHIEDGKWHFESEDQ